MADQEVLTGGVANAGAVVRVGHEVRRPVGPHTPTIHGLLRHVRRRGFAGVPEPLGFDERSERLAFIPGQVPEAPFPPWCQSDEALGSMAILLRRFHDATVGFRPPQEAGWNLELAEAHGGEVIAHHDVCPENVVFESGRAVALLDFDFCAPGRRSFDLAALARMCVPIDTPADAARRGWRGDDPAARLGLVAEAYGLADGAELLEDLGNQIAAGGAFVEHRVRAGDPAFTAMWLQMGGRQRYQRRQRWFEANRQRLAQALG